MARPLHFSSHVVAALLLAAVRPLWGEMRSDHLQISRGGLTAAGGLQTGAGGSLMLGAVEGIAGGTGTCAGCHAAAGGLARILDHPVAVRDVRLSPHPDDFSRLEVRWTAPGAELSLARPATAYVVKYSSRNAISNQFDFDAARTWPQGLIPAAPGAQEFLAIGGLEPDTRYAVALEARDRDGNQAYLSNPVFGWTLARTPDGLDFPAVSSVSVTLAWNTHQPLLRRARTFEAVRALDEACAVAVATVTVSVADAPRASAVFGGLSAGAPAYFHVRAWNAQGVPSPWSVCVSTMIGVGLPGPEPFSDVGPERITANWNAGSNGPGALYQAGISTNAAFSPALELPLAPAEGLFSQVFMDLPPNTPFYFRARAFNADLGAASQHSFLGSTLTLASPALTGAVDAVYRTSAAFSWSDAGNPGDYSFLVEASTAPDFSGELPASLVFPPASSAALGGLETGTRYHARLWTLNAAGARSGPGSFTGAPFVTRPAPAPGVAAQPFIAVSSASVTYAWKDGGNPPGADYVVVATSHPAGDFDAWPGRRLFLSAPAVLEATLIDLPADRTQHVRVAAVNRYGLPGDFSSVRSTATLAAPVEVGAFDVFSASITARWDLDGRNAPDTRYRLEDLASGYVNDAVSGPFFTHGPLPVNSSHTYRVRASNRDGVPTDFSIEKTTWTLAAPPPALRVGRNGPFSIQWTLAPGDNPTGPPRADTQFAVRALSVSPGGLLERPYLKTAAGGGVFLLDGDGADEEIWKTFAEWGGLFISSGLAPGRAYRFVAYARNGDRGIGPRVVAGPGPAETGFTLSREPVLTLNGVTGSESVLRGNEPPDRWIWSNAPSLPFLARNAFHNHFEFVPDRPAPAIGRDNHASFPGWSGDIDPSAPAHDQVSDPDHAGEVSGFRPDREGRWFLHVVGDGRIGPAAPPPYDGHAGDVWENRSPFMVFVDTTPPAAADLDLRAQRGVDNDTPILSSAATGWGRPYFFWKDPNLAAVGDRFRVSPSSGYSWSYSGDSAVLPMASSDPAVNPRWLKGRGEQLADAQPAGTYYFKVIALDQAGNWSAPAVFIYISDPDLSPPRVLDSRFGPSVLVPSDGITVAVAPDAPVRVLFSEEMDPYHAEGRDGNENVYLTLLRDNEGVRRNIRQRVSVRMEDGNRTAVVVPAELLLPGGLYELAANNRVTDLSGNALDPPYRKKFYVLMDPSRPNRAFASDEGVRVSFAPGAWGEGPAGLAINGDPMRFPMAAAGLPRDIDRANAGAAAGGGGGFARPVRIYELSMYDAAAQPLPERTYRDVELSLSYPDQDQNGVVDGAGLPVREQSLALCWLDNDTGAWVRVPGASVDREANTVTARVRHFSVYALMGAPDPDLSGAYAYPVPFKPSLGHDAIVFGRLSSAAVIHIYAADGGRVRELREEDGDGVLRWDVTDDRGDPLASDAYFYVITNGREKKTGRIVVVR